MSGVIVCTCTGVSGKDYARWEKGKQAIKDLYGRSIEEGSASQVTFEYFIQPKYGDFFIGNFTYEFDGNRLHGEIVWC